MGKPSTQAKRPAEKGQKNPPQRADVVLAAATAPTHLDTRPLGRLCGGRTGSRLLTERKGTSSSV